MNLFLRELRTGRKTFLIWTVGMFALCFVGIIKYQSYTASGAMTELLASFPRIVLAVMGIMSLDIGTLSGYTALLFYYILICTVIYAVHLGTAAVSRESVDKTYEFVFTKPRSRSWILARKLGAAYLYLVAFCILNGVFSMLAAAYLNTGEAIGQEVALFSLSTFLIGALFTALAALFSAGAKRPEKGALWGNFAFFYALILGMTYNLLESPGLLRLISPFQYFLAPDLIAGRFDILYTLVTLLLTTAFLRQAFHIFSRKDLV